MPDTKTAPGADLPLADAGPGAYPGFDTSRDAFEFLLPGVTVEMAKVAVRHTIHVQGGFSTLDEEARGIADVMAGFDGYVFPLDRYKAEVAAALAARNAADAAPVEDVSGDRAELDTAKVRRLRDLKNQLRESEAATGALKTDHDALEAEVVREMQDAEVPRMSVGDKTLYLNRRTFAQRLLGVTAADVRDALRAAGAADLVTETVNANTLSSYVREFHDPDNPKPFPPELAAVLELGERWTVGMTAAGRRKS